MNTFENHSMSTKMHEKMIEASNIHKSFGNLEVLKGVDLSVEKGEVVAIVGPSGAGKTTLLQILGTIDKPNDGIVSINGVTFSKLSEKELSAFRNRNIGFVFQFHQLLPEFTALENVMFPALIAGKEVKKTTDKAKKFWRNFNFQTVCITNPTNCRAAKNNG